MKKAALLFISPAFHRLNSCVMRMGPWNSGNGNVVEETRDISGFTGVHVSSGIDVYLSEGNDFEVRVEADENLMEVIVTELKGDMLVVGTDNVNIRNAKSKKVHVTLPELESLKISSAGDCDGQTPFNCDDLRLWISAVPGICHWRWRPKESTWTSVPAVMHRIAGKTNVLDVSLSSAGDLHAFDLIAEKVDVNVSSAGDARVHATEEISMNASSAGNIYYKGDAKVVHSRRSSAGILLRKIKDWF